MSDSAFRRSLSLDGAIKMGICLLKMIRGCTRCSTEPKAKPLDLDFRHGFSMLGEHFGKVLLGHQLASIASDFDTPTYRYRKLSDLVHKADAFDVDQPEGGGLRIRLKAE